MNNNSTIMFHIAYDKALDGESSVIDAQTIIDLSQMLHDYRKLVERIQDRHKQEMRLLENELTIMKSDYDDLLAVHIDMVNNVLSGGEDG